MCGIAVIVDRKGRNSADALRRAGTEMIGRLGHRGPDSHGSWFDSTGGVGVFQTRLAIIDPSAGGDQPMTSRDGKWVVSFNGELYNYVELAAKLPDLSRSDSFSDTRVLTEWISVHGVLSLLQNADGMFAFAAWHIPTEVLTLARDPFGEKPLYYRASTDSLIAASELKAIKSVADCGSIRTSAVSDMLRYGYVSAPESIYESVETLKAGHLATWARSEGRVVLERYWHPGEPSSDTQLPAPTLDEVEATLRRSVTRRLRSDVGIGCFLSRGIDSTAAAAIAASATSDLHTYTVVNPTHPDRDEGPEAAKIARQLGSIHHEINVDLSDTATYIPKLPQIWDEPFGDASQLPTLMVSHAASAEVRVILSGDGGDEIFAGYNRHTKLPRIARFTGLVPLRIRRDLAQLLLTPTNQRARRWLMRSVNAHSTTPELHFQKLVGILAADGLAGMYEKAIAAGPLGPQVKAPPERAEMNGLRDLQIQDILGYLAGDILTKVDRATMFYSIESRTPYLSREVWDLASRFRPSDLVDTKRGRGKLPLRQLVDRYVDNYPHDAPKTGFGIPIDELLRSGLSPWATQLIGDATDDNYHGVLSSDDVRALLTEHQNGTADHQSALWVALMWLQWLDLESTLESPRALIH